MTVSTKATAKLSLKALRLCTPIWPTPQRLRETLSANRIEAVVHMAADSLVGESCEHPAKYYRNNVVNGLILLDAMRADRC